MARSNYRTKLSSLRSRRLGLDVRSDLAKAAAQDETLLLSESYVSRTSNEAVRYVIGSMQELEPTYTSICYEEGQRVINQITSGLGTYGIPASYEYQGSLPLNIHIRFASDVDILVLHRGFFTSDPRGSLDSSYVVVPGTPIENLIQLRKSCESILEQAYPAANVDKTGSKSISISGGSLRRKVDVVPSCWHNTVQYQTSGRKHDREVKVLDKNIPTTITNSPFLHMLKIETKDVLTDGGAKKVIRLLKNVRSDSERNIKLSSYEIAALVWNFESVELQASELFELRLLANAQRIIDWWARNPQAAKKLIVPDGSRYILDTSEKVDALVSLSCDLDEIVLDVASELAGPNESLSLARDILSRTTVA